MYVQVNSETVCVRTCVQWTLSGAGHLWDHMFCWLGVLVSENMHGILNASIRGTSGACSD